ncbi:uridine kinase [Mesoplasma photuris]|uniref:uridine kinase n=1 Tax=Mesoplasma photuris TaxID=217731 RepID=UPI0004E21267|nr:uridine kinase [Mesoplasma photuris]
MKQVSIILIAGGTASGKTTVSQRVADVILKDHSVTHLSMDNYYCDNSNMSFEERKKLNFDHPNLIDIKLLVEHINKLKNRQPIEVPIYDFNESSRTKEVSIVNPVDVIILDGIFALHFKELLQLADIKLFIKTPDDIRFIRRLSRDIAERGFTTEQVINYYTQFVRPMHQFFVEPSINNADVIIPYDEGNEVAIDIIATKIKSIAD